MRLPELIDYTPPPTVREFIRDMRPHELFYSFITGPLGSGKTTGLFMKLVRMATLQTPGPDKIRRTRCVIVRNTAPQLKDTTIASWNMWFKDGQAGTWRATERNFTLRFGDVECEVLFRPLDTPDDISRVLSLELTFAILDEFVQIPRPILEALSGRVGRYPSAKDGGATNWGIWGASNPDVEDNWWYDYLFGPAATRVDLPANFATLTDADWAEWERPYRNDVNNVHYFRQPGGLDPTAENLENLPPRDGSPAYYTNLAKGKSKEWIEQFINGNWGFSAAGKPVVGTFNPKLHISKSPLLFQPVYPLVIGLDPGLEGTGVVFTQQDMNGRVLVLGEIVETGFGTERLIKERLLPYIRRRFPNAEIIVAPDPAAANRAQTDERAVVDVLRKHFPGCVKIETDNRLPRRLDAIDYYTTRLIDGEPALLIDEKQCPHLIRGLRGGWRFEVVTKNDTQKAMPEKNAHSHVCDGFAYACRYFHRGSERGLRPGQTVDDVRGSRPPTSRGVRYCFR